MGTAQLNYSITARRLWGSAGTQHISMVAVSGGRAGSKIPGAVDLSVANNVFKIGQKKVSPNVDGGPLPIGNYQIELPAENLFGKDHFVYSAKLTPVAGGFTFGMMGRAEFYIHGRGNIGSHGCIVPMTTSDFHNLMTALKQTAGGEITVWP